MQNLKINSTSTPYYRCGYCGMPTDKDGNELNADASKEWQEDKAELVHGNC